MRVKLAVQLSGTRDGELWPKIGSIVDLPDDEARDMLRSGTAVEPETADVDTSMIPETAQHEPPYETAVLPPDDRRPNLSAIGLPDDGDDDSEPDTGSAEESRPLTTENGPSKTVRRSSKPTK